jgi:hypothetical protein
MNETEITGPAVPCYVSGKGMHATTTTWTFKTLVIDTLESSGLGYDTRYRYYRRQFPDMPPGNLARLICDPIEYYDRDWPAWRAARGEGVDELRAVTEFMLERDHRFRDEAKVAIYCYDEAGFGSGINTMRFLGAGKPVLGFCNRDNIAGSLNFSNVLQLEIDYPRLFTLLPYRSAGEIPAQLRGWLESRADG